MILAHYQADGGSGLARAEVSGRAARRFSRRAGFTLIELLVVVGVIALLAGLLMPSLTAARDRARAVACQSNLKHLARASLYYVEANHRTFCPGAAEFLANLHRWHGTREEVGEPFDPATGPLVPYLGAGGEIRQCPSFDAVAIGDDGGGFERGNGGYGYNNAYIGVRGHATGSGQFVVSDDRVGARADRVKQPAGTLMFADSAFAGARLIEYSFAEPRFHPSYPTYRMDPSIHFRHDSRANVAWCDGHIDAQDYVVTHKSGYYAADPERYRIGWFGKEDDNRFFDLR